MPKPTIPSSFQLSQINSSAVQAQLKAAGILITDENAESIIMSTVTGTPFKNVYHIGAFLKE